MNARILSRALVSVSVIALSALPAGAQSPTPPPSAPAGATETLPSPTTPPPGTAPQPAAAADASGVDGEIVITANKRVENVQNVPKSVQVVTTQQLTAQNVVDLSDLRKVAPSVQGGGQTLAIRGVATSASSIAAQNKVGVTLDDIPQPSRAILANNLIDIERVEVLPGPQGTLSGRNATGGLINIVTRGPSETLTGFANYFRTTDVEQQASAFVAGPVSENTGFSISGFYKDFRGLRKNIILDKWSKSWTYGTRAKLRSEPVDNLILTGTFFFQEQQRRGVAGAGAGVGGGDAPVYLFVSEEVRNTGDNTPGRAPLPFSQQKPGITVGPHAYTFASNLNGQSRVTDTGGIARIEYTVAGQTLTSITSVMKENDPILSDGLHNVIPLARYNLRPEFDGYNRYENRTRYTTQEFRLNSPSTGDFRYVAGLFYNNLKQSFDYSRVYNPVNWLRDFYTKSYSAYAHADWDVIDRFTIQGGIRYEKDKIKYKWTFLPIGPASKINDLGQRLDFPAVNPLIVSQNRASDDFVNFDVGAQYHIKPDVMLYATYAQANQGPVFDAEDNVTAIGGNTQATAGMLQPLGQERVKSYEAGIKSQFLDRRVTLNISVFQANYDNYQAQTVVIPDDPALTPILKLAAVGKVRTRGVEAQLNTILSDAFRIDTNLSYTDAKILDFPNAPCYTGQTVATGCFAVGRGTSQGNLSGKTLANAPKFKANVQLGYTRPINDNGLKFFATANVRYQSKLHTDILNAPFSYLDDLLFVNATAGIRARHFSVELFVNNLFKDHAETYGVSDFGLVAPAGAIIRVRNINRDNNRYGGIRIGYQF